MRSEGRKFIYLIEQWKPPGTQGSTGGTLYNYMLVSALSKIGRVEIIAINVTGGPLPANVTLTQIKEPKGKFKGHRAFYWRDFLLSALPEKTEGVTLLTTTSTNAVVPDARKKGFTTFSIVQAYEDYGLKKPGSGFLEKIRSLRKLVFTGQLFKRGLMSADYLVANSNFIASSLRSDLEVAASPFLLYPPMTLEPNFDYQFTDEAARSVGFVNRAGKNLDFILMLARAVPEKAFLIYGHEMRNTVELPENVVFVGWASDRIKMFRSARIWLMPSLWCEPFGLVAVEAMSQGCQVAVSNKGGLPEAVGEHGKIFSDFDIKKWRDWLLGDANKNHAVGLDSHLKKVSTDEFCKNVTDIFV